ncbi:MAG TPA: TetR/AcrR family transcriptional regulator [Solirubrobacteraceae bacterium]|nr:TetR/AcrR family transcriptional regulator [Solirubrobacteraceae bacterium]
MIERVAERGFAGVTVKLVTSSAQVSSRTFYEHFAGLEACFSEVLDLGLARALALVGDAFAREERWQDGVRAALASVLAYFDDEPVLARVLFVEAMAAGSWALERREDNVAALRQMIVEHWSESDAGRPEPVAVAGVMASVLGIIHSHLVTRDPRPLIELLGPLMGIVTTPYQDRQAVAREIERGAQLARTVEAGWHIDSTAAARAGASAAAAAERLETLPPLLCNPQARRARECLLFLAARPDSSNREIAAGVGIAHQSQISRLLSELGSASLVAKRSAGPGRRNAWRLTARGERIAGVVAADSQDPEPELPSVNIEPAAFSVY